MARSLSWNSSGQRYVGFPELAVTKYYANYEFVHNKMVNSTVKRKTFKVYFGRGIQYSSKAVVKKKEVIL